MSLATAQPNLHLAVTASLLPLDRMIYSNVGSGESPSDVRCLETIYTEQVYAHTSLVMQIQHQQPGLCAIVESLQHTCEWAAWHDSTS